MTNRLVARVLLERRDCHVIEVECSSEAVDLVKNEYIDLVLVPVDIPQMERLKVIQIIRNRSLNSNLSIVALTAVIGNEVMAKCLEAGASSVLEKPLKPDQLDGLMSLLNLGACLVCPDSCSHTI